MIAQSQWGPFRPYVPTDDSLKALLEMGTIFACTDKGEDWYDVVHKLPPSKYALCVNGNVVSVSNDPTSFALIDGATLFAAGSDVEVGWRFDGQTLTPPPPPSIDDLRKSAKSKINARAELARSRFTTSGVGQAAVYREKLEQAEQVMADGKAAAESLSPEQAIGQYPLLAASIGSEADTLWDAAELVVATYRTWAQRAGQIETRRLQALQAVYRADSPEAVASVLAALSFEGI